MKTDAFALRHIGPRESDLKYMFKTIGVENLDQLISETVPNNIRLKKKLPHLHQLQVLIRNF